MAAVLLAAVALATTALADASVAENATAYNNLDAYGEVYPFQEYKSHPDIKSPIFLVNELNEDLLASEGYLFVGEKYDFGSPYIFSAKDLSLVYADPTYDRVFDTRVQEIDGEKYLTFWHGTSRDGGQADGFCILMDESYEVKYNVTAQNLDTKSLADLHELKVTDDGTVLFAVYNPVKHDMTALGGGADEALMDSMFQEVDPKTGELLFSWSAAEHFNVSDSVAEYADGQNGVGGLGFDFFHINSVDKTKDGNYLVSGRHMSLVSLVSGKDGSIIWKIGSNDGDFTDPTGGTAVAFGLQHDARFANEDGTEITMFDNRRGVTGTDCEGNCSRGLHIKIDPEKKTAEIIKEYYHPTTNYSSGFMGSYQALSKENVLTAWGSHPSIVEYTRDGEVAMDIQIGALNQGNGQGVYRAYKMDWVGKPGWDPKIASNRSADNSTTNATVYVSWNGATEVANWVVYGTDAKKFQISGNLELGRSERKGFETEISLGEGEAPKFVAAVALDSKNETLGMTGVMDITTGEKFDKPDPEPESNDTSLDGEGDEEDGARAVQAGVWGVMAAVGVAVLINAL